MIVGVVPDPASAWPGFTMPEFRYVRLHCTFGLPLRARKRYMRLLDTM
jgi:hypothetical protein